MTRQFVITLIVASTISLAPHAVRAQSCEDCLHSPQTGVRISVADQIHALNSIDPENTEYSDLEPLAKMIGDARVVQLGELTHGAGDSFAARIRITRFLHERMGFDLVLFETPMFLSERMNQLLATDRPLSEVIDLAMFPIWAHSAEMQQLFQYIRESKDSLDPIDVYGVDAQLLGYPDEADLIAKELRTILSADPDPVAADIEDRMAKLIADLQKASGVKFDSERFLHARVLLSDARFLVEAPNAAVRRATSVKQRAWGARMVSTLGYILEDRAILALAPPFRGDFKAYAEHPAVHAGQNRRDQAMASNIAWFVNDYCPGRKAVVWIANSHAQECAGFMHKGNEDFPALRQHTTGSYLTGILGNDDVFTLLHSAYEGGFAGSFERSRKHGHRWVEHKLEPAPQGTLAHALHEAGVERAIVDLSNPPQGDFKIRKALEGELPRSLPAYGDGILYLDVDRPATPRADAPIQSN